jgi:hypothetical protein
MALSTYAQLQARVARWIDRDDLTEDIPEFIQLAEAQMLRDLRERGALVFPAIVALSDDVPSNWVLADHPDAYLGGALVHAYNFLRDPEGAGTWAGFYSSAISGIVDKYRRPGGELKTELAAVLGQRAFDINEG